MKRFALAFVATALIATTARAQVDDAGPIDDVGPIEDVAPFEDAVADAVTSDAAPGPRLPNGEPAPPPDLQADIGGCSCTMTPRLATPLPLVFGALLVLRLRRRR